MKSETNHILLKNNAPSVDFDLIPVLDYGDFESLLTSQLSDHANHILVYYAFENDDKLQYICAVARDHSHDIAVFSHTSARHDVILKSLTNDIPQIHMFEREIMENFGVVFSDHPWNKPVRYAHNRQDKSLIMNNYPFYSISGEELHEVGVGPIHAGIIEPGHFRFICNGEKVLHLEIQLGYQHRGVEKMFLQLKKPLQRMILAESIAGDTTVGHGLAHVQLIESLSHANVSPRLQIERMIALELERIAVHIGDTAALCTDVAYQFGQVVNEALRTTIINTTQLLCGNRFGKGLIRTEGTNYPITDEFLKEMNFTLDDSGKRYMDMADRIYSLPSVLMRFDGNGIVTHRQTRTIGAVGMAARSCGISRDTRTSHPFQGFKEYSHTPVLRNAGDVLSRGMLRNIEVRNSLKIIHSLVEMLNDNSEKTPKPSINSPLKPNSFSISLIEGWRGEICHCAITNQEGDLKHYKVKDPSMHNWMALALAVRNQEISDFPINNKSFNLSYCGFDL